MKGEKLTDTWKQRLAPYLPAATVLGTLVAMHALAVIYIGSLINAQTRVMEARFDVVDTRFTSLEESVDTRFKSLERAITELDTSVETRILGLEKATDAKIQGLEDTVNATINGFQQTVGARIDGSGKGS